MGGGAAVGVPVTRVVASCSRKLRALCAFVSTTQNWGVHTTGVFGTCIPQKIKSITESNEEPPVLIKPSLITWPVQLCRCPDRALGAVNV